MLRYSNIFLLLLFFTIPAPVPAVAEMMIGTVHTVDREADTFVLRTDTDQDIQVHSSISPLPGRMMPGKQIRIWGDYAADNKTFTATDIRGHGKTRHHDPTGVRDRIGNGKYCRNPANGRTVDEKSAHRPHGEKRGYGNGRAYGKDDSSQ